MTLVHQLVTQTIYKKQKMKQKLLTSVSVATLVMASTPMTQAVPITGNIGFAGSVQLNSQGVTTATTAINWFGTIVTPNSTSGVFLAEFGSAGGVPVVIASPWNFTSGAIANFWSVGGSPQFVFNLASSSVVPSSAGFRNVLFYGTVSAAGFDTTAFSGSFSVQDPPANGIATFSESLSFHSVPDENSTIMLLGAAIFGLALINRKSKVRIKTST